MQKIFIVLGVVVLSVVGVLMWKKQAAPDQMSQNQEKISVVATFYPLEDFARAVGGNRAEVTSIVPAGAEPHEYEPTPQDILKAYQADIVLLNGAGVDAWAEKIRPELEQRGIKVVQMSELMTLLPGAHEEEEEGAEAEEHEESPFDPHFWLDPKSVEKEVAAIRDAFVSRDPAGKAVYDRNSEAFLANLEGLDASYRMGLASCELHSVVTSHNAFSYMGQRYGFETIPLAGLSPESEPSSRRLAEVAQLVKEQGIKHVFFETLVNPKLAQTLATETGAEPLVFNPLEGLTDEERAAGENYLSIMKQNLENLKTALQCQK